MLNENKGRKERKVPKKITPARLENIALYYLERYSSSAANLQKVLMRRVHKSVRHHEDLDREEAREWVDETVEKMKGLGYVNDEAYAEMKSRAFHRQGKPPRAISQALAAKGVDRETTASALETLADERGERDLELSAAITFARKKRLGPHRLAEDREERKQKDMATLGRNGFSYETARKVLEAETVEELEELLEEMREEG